MCADIGVGVHWDVDESKKGIGSLQALHWLRATPRPTDLPQTFRHKDPCPLPKMDFAVQAHSHA